MLWKHAPHRPLNFVGQVRTQIALEPISYHNAVTFDMGNIPVMVADVGVGEHNKLQVVVPRGAAGEAIIDELKEQLHAKKILFSSGLESHYLEPNARHIFVGNGIADRNVPAQRVSKQQVLLLLEAMQHARGINATIIIPLSNMVSVKQVAHVANISKRQFAKLQKTISIDYGHL